MTKPIMVEISHARGGQATTILAVDPADWIAYVYPTGYAELYLEHDGVEGTWIVLDEMCPLPPALNSMLMELVFAHDPLILTKECPHVTPSRDRRPQENVHLPDPFDIGLP